MGRRSSWLYGGIVAVALAGMAPGARADVACGDAAGDDADLAAAWSSLQDACPCKTAKARKWRKERESFVKCARKFAAGAIANGEIRQECRTDLMRAARRSTCSRKKEAVACCRTSHNGNQSCTVLNQGKNCKPNSNRYAEPGETDSCLDACDNVSGPACLTDAECDDGNPCTGDSCDPAVGCKNILDPFCEPSGGSGGGGGTSCSGTGASTHGLSSLEQKLAKLINDYRKSRGSLATCTSLSKAAQDHANDMRDKKYYAHKGANGSEFWERACKAGYKAGCGPSTWMGEIITGWASTAEGAFQMWKNSPGHDALMKERNYVVMGIGHACGGPLGHYWVVDFGGTSESSCK